MNLKRDLSKAYRKKLKLLKSFQVFNWKTYFELVLKM